MSQLSVPQDKKKIRECSVERFAGALQDPAQGFGNYSSLSHLSLAKTDPVCRSDIHKTTVSGVVCPKPLFSHNMHSCSDTGGTTCPRCRTAHKEPLCRATTHDIPRVSLQQYSLEDSRPRSPSNLERLKALSDEREHTTTAHPAHSWHQHCCSVRDLHLLPSSLVQLWYQSSVLTIVDLFCCSARLLPCHCCVFFFHRSECEKSVRAFFAYAPRFHAETDSGSRAPQSPIHRLILKKHTYTHTHTHGSSSLSFFRQFRRSGRTTAFVF